MNGEKVCKFCWKSINDDFKVCPYCGEKIEEKTDNENRDKKNCKFCGNLINDDFKVCPYCGNNVEEQSLEMNCKLCGKSINKYFKVCPYCGEKVENKNGWDNSQKVNSSTIKEELDYNIKHDYYQISKKSGIVCLFLLGPLWAHRFYAGKIVSALFLLILSIITICLFRQEENMYKLGGSILTIIIFIVLLVDFTSIATGKFTDSKGKYIKINN